MPFNTDIYPLDFQQVGESSAIQNGVDALAIATRAAALKQQLNKRLAGLFSVRNQNKQGRYSNLRMSFDVVGSNTPVFVVSGSIGYFVGGTHFFHPAYNTIPPIMNGTRIEHMPFAGEWVNTIGSRLTVGRQNSACFGNKRAFWTAGGYSGPPTMHSLIDRTTLASEDTVQISAQLTAKGYGMVGCGNNTKGYTFGAFNDAWFGLSYGAGRRIHSLAYDTEAVALLAAQFDVLHCSDTTTAGDKAQIFLFGGVKGDNANPFWSSDNRIRSFSMTTETLSLKAATTTGIGDFLGSAKFGNQNVIYILGGIDAAMQSFRTANARKIARYRIATDLITLLGLQLDSSRAGLGGFSSNISGYVGGGYGVGTFSVRGLEKLSGIDATESIAPIGATLVVEHAGLAGVSDYAAGHSS